MNPSDDVSRGILACLGDSSRFRLVLSILEHERCVSELAGDVGLSQSCTTRHLQYLEREGIVVGVRAQVARPVVPNMDAIDGGLGEESPPGPVPPEPASASRPAEMEDWLL
jgi:DNA-binding Lrp family transcriptional regulator